MPPPDIHHLAVSLMQTHGCHTAILYGSYARGDATDASDVDLLCIRDDGPSVRDARLVLGVYLDAFVEPASKFSTLEPSVLRLFGGVVLYERDGFGSALLQRIHEMHEAGPTPMPEDERQALLVWSRKMLSRSQNQEKVDASYRRMFLQVQALEDYFLLRNMWFRGSKESFAWLHLHDRPVYELFERAGRADARDQDLEALVAAVYRLEVPAMRTD